MSFPITQLVERKPPSGSTTYSHSSFMPRIHANVSTCSVWVLPTCRVIQSEEHFLESLGIPSLPGTAHVVPRRWNLAWLVLDNPCQAQFRLEIEIAPAWACCARHNENPITIVLILYNLVRSL